MTEEPPNGQVASSASAPDYDIQRQLAADVLTKAGDRAATVRRDLNL